MKTKKILIPIFIILLCAALVFGTFIFTMKLFTPNRPEFGLSDSISYNTYGSLSNYLTLNNECETEDESKVGEALFKEVKKLHGEKQINDSSLSDLLRYQSFENVDKIDLNVNYITTKKKGSKYFVWTSYTIRVKAKDGSVISGSGTDNEPIIELNIFKKSGDDLKLISHYEPA